MTFVSDWLIDAEEFIVEQPVGHTAPTKNLAPAETAVLENAACANTICGVSLRTCLCEFVPYTPVCRRTLSLHSPNSIQTHSQAVKKKKKNVQRIHTTASFYCRCSKVFMFEMCAANNMHRKTFKIKVVMFITQQKTKLRLTRNKPTKLAPQHLSDLLLSFEPFGYFQDLLKNF